MLTAAIALAAFLAVAVGLPLLVRLMFRTPRVVAPLPAGLAAEDVRIATANGKQLAAWYLPPPGGVGPAVVLMHGWGSGAAHLMPLAKPLQRAGLAVLLPDARCHGRSDQDSFASMPRFAEDLSSALDWLSARPEVTRLGAIGHSVGGAALILTASRRHDLTCAVSVAAFAHPRVMMLSWLKAWRIPYRPLGWWILRHVEKSIGHAYDDIAAVTVIGHVACPLLLVHGRLDRSVPVADAVAIHAARGDAPVDLLVVDAMGHGGPRDAVRLANAVAPFLRRHLLDEDLTPTPPGARPALPSG